MLLFDKWNSLKTSFGAAGFGMTVGGTATKEWHRDGKLHRDNGPAIEQADGSKEWYRNGRWDRDDGPAVEMADGTKVWMRDDKIHREGGPAVEHANGTKEWYSDGRLHRETGPAIERPNGTKVWYLAGQRVRAEGPNADQPNTMQELEFMGQIKFTPRSVGASSNVPMVEDLGTVIQAGLTHNVSGPPVARFKL
ncbi:MAG TPA: hypothetical protein VEF76_10495 [Patescibacteria group bacterium]|nr:hypothetical protein [Patescibacteria group bacterium]